MIISPKKIKNFDLKSDNELKTREFNEIKEKIKKKFEKNKVWKFEFVFFFIFFFYEFLNFFFSALNWN